MEACAAVGIVIMSIAKGALARQRSRFCRVPRPYRPYFVEERPAGELGL